MLKCYKICTINVKMWFVLVMNIMRWCTKSRTVSIEVVISVIGLLLYNKLLSKTAPFTCLVVKIE